MFRKRTVAGLLTLILLLTSFASFQGNHSIQAAQTSSTSQTEIFFPGDAKFSELESKLQEKSKLSGSAWVDEFKKQPVLAQVRASNGVRGTLYPNALAVGNVLAGQTPFILYGTINIPSGAKLGGKDLSGDFGIVVFSEPLAIALIDLASGSVKAFIVVPLQGQTIPLLSLPLTIFSPLWVFQLLASLVTVSASASQAPTPPSAPQSEPSCLQELPNKSNVNVPLNTASTITTVKDSAGKELFAILVDPPKSLTVKSSGAFSLQFLYTTAKDRNLGVIVGPGELPVELTADVPFALYVVATNSKAACLLARPKQVNGVLTLTGTLSTN